LGVSFTKFHYLQHRSLQAVNVAWHAFFSSVIPLHVSTLNDFFYNFYVVLGGAGKPPDKSRWELRKNWFLDFNSLDFRSSLLSQCPPNLLRAKHRCAGLLVEEWVVENFCIQRSLH
jgi:hypothetical protein